MTLLIRINLISFRDVHFELLCKEHMTYVISSFYPLSIFGLCHQGNRNYFF